MNRKSAPYFLHPSSLCRGSMTEQAPPARGSSAGADCLDPVHPTTVTLAWAFRPSAETVTWNVPVPFFGALYSPVLLMVPPPLLTCQVKVGCEASAWPH